MSSHEPRVHSQTQSSNLPILHRRYSADGTRIPEILAPAGGREQFFAALNSGADAVYLGLKGFNARARAENFDIDDLRELVPLAHAYGMQVLVTVNVLIKEAELVDLVTMLAALEEVEVDAIIVQDLGVARIVRTHFPHLRLHASTQMAVHNLAGVLAARDLGFRRVVLARELTAIELKRIRSAIDGTDIELEVFCHGSLCYSYSGLCFFSGAEDARSGNRGECAYTCRQPYKILSEPGEGFLFSMKDLDTSLSLDQLVQGGVDTLKIEGRKKDAQYVTSTVRLYRHKLDQLFGTSTLRDSAPKFSLESGEQSTNQIENDLSLSFHRQRTSFFVHGRYHENVIDLENPTHQGLPLGIITAVEKAHSGHDEELRVSLKTEVAIERFDGLRVAPTASKDLMAKYDNRFVEFSLRDFWVNGHRATSADAASLVTIAIPMEATSGRKIPKVGDVLTKVRSADLKRRVQALTQPPVDTRLKSLRSVTVDIDASLLGEKISLTAKATKFGANIATAEFILDPMTPRSANTFTGDCEDVFSIFGEQGFRAKKITVNAAGNWFVPRSILKKLKNHLGTNLARNYTAWENSRLASALAALRPGAHAASRPTDDTERFTIKIDRLASLDAIRTFMADHPNFPLTEITFEPKRSHLPSLDPKAWLPQLLGDTQSLNVKLRLAIPTVIRAWDEPLLKRWFKEASSLGINAFECGNLGALRLVEDWGLSTQDLASDFSLYALNSETFRHWRDCGLKTVCLSIEDDFDNLSSHLSKLDAREAASAQVILYKDTPLFIAEACSLTALHKGCPTSDVCGYRTLTIANPAGDVFYVAHESCKSIVYGDKAYSISDRQEKLRSLGIRNFRVDFLTKPYTDTTIRDILAQIARASKVPHTHSANFDRSLL